MGRKKDTDQLKGNNIEDIIQEEIQNRVFNESMNLREERKKLEREKINLDVLEEMSDLSRERIEEIADDVRRELLGNKGHTSDTTPLSVIRWGIVILFGVAAVVFAVIKLQSSKPALNTDKPVAPESSSSAPSIVKKQPPGEIPEGVKADYTALLAAVKNGNGQMVVFLLDKGTPLHMHGYGKTALHTAVNAGYIHIVKLLLERGAVVTFDDISAAEDKGNVSIVNILCSSFVDASPAGSGIRKLWDMGFSFSEKSLIRCIQENNLPAIELFVKDGVIVSTASLKAAVKSGSPEALSLLMINKDKFRYKNHYDPSILLSIAAGEGKTDMFKLLLNGLTGIRKIDADSLLINESGKDNLDIVKALVEWGADMDYSTNDKSPLINAATPVIAGYLLQQGANPNIKNADGRTPIMARIYDKHYMNAPEDPKNIEIVKLLIKHGGDIHIRDNKGRTALDCAREMNSPEIEKLLKEAGANLSLTNENFFLSVKTGDTATLGKCLKNGIDVNTKDRHGDTALVIAAKQGNTEIMKILLANGADPNARERVGVSEDGNTPLIMAVSKTHVENVKLLIDHGANVNAMGWLEKSPFLIAVQKIRQGSSKEPDNPSVDVIKLLIDGGLDLKSEPAREILHRALSKAIYYKNPELTGYLLDKGADPNHKNTYGVPMILQHNAIWKADIAKTLLDHGADVNATDRHGNTALMLAAKSGVTDTVKLLLKNGADASLENKKGQKAFDLGKTDTVKKLLDNPVKRKKR